MLAYDWVWQFQYKLDSITISYVDPITQNLTSLLWNTFYYDAQGRCTTAFIYAGSGAPIGEKRDNTYDINNNLIEIYESNFDSMTLTWDTIGHYINTYDMNNNIVKKVWQYWSGNQWDNNNRRLYYYNSNNERTYSDNFDWNTSSNQWVLASCKEYAYQSGQPIILIETLAFPSTSCSDTAGRREWSYLGNNLSYEARFNNSDFNPIEETTFFCNSIPLANTAIPTYTNSYFYHSLGLFENQIDSATNELGSSTLHTYKYHYSTFTSTTIEEVKITIKQLLKITDLLGRETKGTKNEVLFYIYDDGTVEKRIVIE